MSAKSHTTYEVKFVLAGTPLPEGGIPFEGQTIIKEGNEDLYHVLSSSGVYKGIGPNHILLPKGDGWGLSGVLPVLIISQPKTKASTSVSTATKRRIISKE